MCVRARECMYVCVCVCAGLKRRSCILSFFNFYRAFVIVVAAVVVVVVVVFAVVLCLLKNVYR